MQEDLEAAIVSLGECMTQSEVGELVARVFARERESFAALLEERLGNSYAIPNGAGPESAEWVGCDALTDTTRKDNAFTRASPIYSPTASDDLTHENTRDTTSCPTLLSSGTILVNPAWKLAGGGQHQLTSEPACRPSRLRRAWVRNGTLAGALLMLLAMLFRPIAKSEPAVQWSPPTNPPARNSSQVTPVAPEESAKSIVEAQETPAAVVSSVLAIPSAHEPTKRLTRPDRFSLRPSYNSACSASLPSRQRLLGCGALSERK